MCLPINFAIFCVPDSMESVVIRGQRVILDRALARLFNVSIKVLKDTVRRNRQRFPPDFVFQLTIEEVKALDLIKRSGLTSQRKHVRRRPYAFTEVGILMLSSVLKSERAIQANIQIIRAFIYHTAKKHKSQKRFSRPSCVFCASLRS
jgi:hypothetical protein